MLQFTYAPSHTDKQRTAPTVVLCVVALHVLAIGAFLRSPEATPLDHPQAMAIEMVLAPAPKVTATPASTSEKSTPAPAQTAATASPAPSPISASQSLSAAQTTTAAVPATSARAASTQTGSPAFSLPSSEAHGLNNPQPVYPRVSRRLNEQGQVVIRVFVAADGSAQQGEVKASSGYDRLDQEALRTVMRWRFVPGQRLGTPEAMWFNVPVHFVLE